MSSPRTNVDSQSKLAFLKFQANIENNAHRSPVRVSIVYICREKLDLKHPWPSQVVRGAEIMKKLKDNDFNNQHLDTIEI